MALKYIGSIQPIRCFWIMAGYTKLISTTVQRVVCKNHNIKNVLLKDLNMLVVNRYENRQTGKVTIQAHVIKGKKLIKSYAPCCHSLIGMIAQNYSFYMLCDVDYYSKLSNVKIVDVK